MKEVNKDEGLSRRRFLELAAGGSIFAGVMGWLYKLFSVQPTSVEATPTNPELVLERIKELPFNPGSELRSTLFFRKIMWEMAQVHKMKGTWESPHDESDWLNNNDIFEPALAELVAMGLKGGRLVIVPFEVTYDGITFDWEAIDTAIELMQKYDLAVELCIGPLDYPYYPGIRLPLNLQQNLLSEFQTKQQTQIHIGMGVDHLMPDSSAAIRDFGMKFTDEVMARYGEDTRIEKFYVGNEWPDRHAIEGLDGNLTMTVGLDYMEEVVRRVKRRTEKPIALNTNIHPSEPTTVTAVLGPLLEILGSQGILGFDTYPTREAESTQLRPYMSQYRQLMDSIRENHPETTLVFTEYQAEPWPPDDLAGQSWAQIFTEHPELIQHFYQNVFPHTLETHVIPSDITEIGLWGAPVLPVVKALGYDFPARLMTTIAETMGSVE